MQLALQFGGIPAHLQGVGRHSPGGFCAATLPRACRWHQQRQQGRLGPWHRLCCHGAGRHLHRLAEPQPLPERVHRGAPRGRAAVPQRAQLLARRQLLPGIEAARLLAFLHVCMPPILWAVRHRNRPRRGAREGQRAQLAGRHLRLVHQQAQAGRGIAAQGGSVMQLLKLCCQQWPHTPALPHELHGQLRAGGLAAGLGQQRAGGGVQRRQLQLCRERFALQVP